LAYKLFTALNVGLILAILILLLRKPGGILMAGVFALVIAICLGLWWFFRRRQTHGRG
jgi:hypothetical protein